MLQQITSWRSVLGSKMGDLALAQQLPTALDETVPPSTALHLRPGFFKQPLPPPQFGIGKLPMPKPSCMASPAPSSVHVGESAAEVSQRKREQSPSPGADDRQRSEHES